MVIEAYELRRAIPCPMGTGDAMNTMVPLTFMMGTQEAYDFFSDLYNELQQKIANKEGIIADEKYRILWGGGLPAWFALTDFNYFNSKGAVFPVETTYRLVEPVYRLDLPKVSDPIEHLAWRWTKHWTYWHDSARKRPGSTPEVERMIQERDTARKSRDWKKADEIRDLLRKKGIVLEDSPEGTRWKKI